MYMCVRARLAGEMSNKCVLVLYPQTAKAGSIKMLELVCVCVPWSGRREH